jgi:hypothetical protein
MSRPPAFDGPDEPLSSPDGPGEAAGRIVPSGAEARDDPTAPTFTWLVVCADAEGPGPRSRHGLVYDRDAGATVLFGGAVWVGGGQGRLPPDTWELRDGGWTRIETPLSPSGRHRASMVFDEARGFTVLFGGQNIRGQNLGKTWIYARRRWRLRRTWWGLQPPPRCGHAMAYDPGRRETVLFGGIDDHDAPLGDTWIFNGSWKRIDGPAPAPRRYVALAYDPELQGCVLHGGCVDDHGREKFGDTWLFRDRSWSPLTGFTTEGRDDHGMAYHRAARALVMLDDIIGTRGLLVRSPSGWRPTAVEPLHPRHQCAPMAWDDRLGGLVLHGGEARHGGPQFDATLVLRLWRDRKKAAKGCQGPGHDLFDPWIA